MQHVLACCIIVIVAWTFHAGSLDGWWSIDDPALLRTTIQHGVFYQFFDPVTWRAHYPAAPVPGIFTPWINATLAMDIWIFGLEPIFFYGHQLLSLSLVGIIAYLFLVRYLSGVYAFSAILLFLWTAPVDAVAYHLQTRHYLEGLGFTLCSMLLFSHAIVSKSYKSSMTKAIIGAFIYLLATSAKEIYAPLPGALLLLPGVTIRRAWRHLLPYGLMAILYAIWRAYMLGAQGMFHAYGDLLWFDWTYIIRFLAAAPRHLKLDDSFRQIVALLSLLPLLLRCCIKKSYDMWRVLGWVALLALPLYRVLDFSAPWYFFAPMLPLCAWILRNAQELWASGWVWKWCMIIWLPLTLIGNAWACWHWPALGATQEQARYREEGQFVLYVGTPGKVLVYPADRWWHYYESLAWLRRQVMHGGKGPAVCYDLRFCPPLQGGWQAYRYIPATASVRQVKEEVLPPRVCASGVADVLHGTMQYSIGAYGVGSLQWRIKPFLKNRERYHLVMANDHEDVFGFDIPIPAAGSFPFNLHQRLSFFVRYEGNGCVLESPLLALQPYPSSVSW